MRREPWMGVSTRWTLCLLNAQRARAGEVMITGSWETKTSLGPICGRFDVSGNLLRLAAQPPNQRAPPLRSHSVPILGESSVVTLISHCPFALPAFTLALLSFSSLSFSQLLHTPIPLILILSHPPPIPSPWTDSSAPTLPAIVVCLFLSFHLSLLLIDPDCFLFLAAQTPPVVSGTP